MFDIKDTCSKQTRTLLMKLVNDCKYDEHIHNLSSCKKIPLKFKALLMLGLKCCVTANPNIRFLNKCLQEALRKLSWRVYFKMNPNKNKFSDFVINCRKDFNSITKRKAKECPIEHEVFNVKVIRKQFESYCRKYHVLDAAIFSNLVQDFNAFCEKNNVMIIEADKNAGICIVNIDDYNNEALRQLNDLSTYHPSTKTAFELDMIKYNDHFSIFEKNLPDNYRMRSLRFETNTPAKFYILPKVHKPFETFPKGRPISSTFRKNNKYVSKLLDQVLRPSLMDVDDLLIDTQHFLLELETVCLDTTRKYHLVSVDVEALYPSLNIRDCKQHCADAFLKSKSPNSIINFNRREILDLLSLSLDYSYVAYGNQLFYQHRGIEMGNASSVSVANIAVFQETDKMFINKPEIILRKRFLDDIFMIIDSTDMEDIHTWLQTVLIHKYLKFTLDISDKCVNFLDVTVSISENNILSTSLYVKPVSRHLYLHPSSNHPPKLKDSLFYSQGLRVIKICSEKSTRTNHLQILFNKFVKRGYKTKNLEKTLKKLTQVDRAKVLMPKKSFLVSYLQSKNPTILHKYGVCTSNTVIDIDTRENISYAVFPFYKCIPLFKQTIVPLIMNNIHNNCPDSLKRHVKDINLKVVFSRTPNLKDLLKRS